MEPVGGIAIRIQIAILENRVLSGRIETVAPANFSCLASGILSEFCELPGSHASFLGLGPQHARAEHRSKFFVRPVAGVMAATMTIVTVARR